MEKLRAGVECEEIARQQAFLHELALSGACEGKTFAIMTYGCQMNAHDSERLQGMLEAAGLSLAPRSQDADVLIFNTCCVREHAEARVFGNIGALRKRKERNPALFIAVCGCMMQQEGVAQALLKRFPFVDMVFGTHSLHAVPELFAGAWRKRAPVIDVRESEGEVFEGLPVSRNGQASAYVTIMYGCNNFCSYCIVPYVRGRERSRLPEAIEAETLELSSGGVKEITLLGQNVNSYGRDLQGIDFAALLERLAALPNAPWLRFMTSHPKDLSDRLISVMSQGLPVCNHVHLPVQSGSERILSLMNRGYSARDYLRLVEKLRSKVPNVEISTDIIVGFPGETDADFQDTLSLVREIGFVSAYTFMFSPRKGTKAATMGDQVSSQVKKARLLELNSLQQGIIEQNNHKYIGQTLDVLIDDVDEAHGLHGRAPCAKMVYLSGSEALAGTVQRVHITGCAAQALQGEI